MTVVEEEKLRRKLQQLRLQRMQIERHMLHLERRMAMQGSTPALRRELERLDERRSKLVEQEEQLLKQLHGEVACEGSQAAPSPEETQTAKAIGEATGAEVHEEAQIAVSCEGGKERRTRRTRRREEKAD